MTDETTAPNETSVENTALIPVAPERVLNGQRVAQGGTVLCSRCSRKLYGGETVLVHAHHLFEERDWATPQLYCSECQEQLIDLELPVFAEGIELLARASLVVASGDGLTSYLTLSHVSVLAQSRTERDEESVDDRDEEDATDEGEDEQEEASDGDEPELKNLYPNWIVRRVEGVFSDDQLSRLADLGLDPEAIVAFAKDAEEKDRSGEVVIEDLEESYGDPEQGNDEGSR